MQITDEDIQNQQSLFNSLQEEYDVVKGNLDNAFSSLDAISREKDKALCLLNFMQQFKEQEDGN